MTRLIALITISIIAGSNIGCVVAVGNKGCRNHQHMQAVELNNEIYVVDVRTNKVRKIPRSMIDNASIANESTGNDRKN